MEQDKPTTIQRLTKKREKELLELIGKQQLHLTMERMYLIRAFEEKAEELYGLGKTHGTMHLSIGQEGTALGACSTVKSGYDYLLNHHRRHGHCLAWGGGVRDDGRIHGQKKPGTAAAGVVQCILRMSNATTWE